jgi:NAD(P)-dependent dehydrogenase (short-subunit alcohol dehydrogenase family)
MGLAVAEAAKAEGSNIVVVSSQPGKVSAALASLSAGVEGYVANLSDETDVETVFRKIGPFDHMVYTAGDTVRQMTIEKTKLEDARTFFSVRFWGAFLSAKHGSKSIRPGGSIVFTSSTVPRRPWVGFAIGACISRMGRCIGLRLGIPPSAARPRDSLYGDLCCTAHPGGSSRKLPCDAEGRAFVGGRNSGARGKHVHREDAAGRHATDAVSRRDGRVPTTILGGR